MTEFTHKPYEKIYVRDMIKLTLDDLIGVMRPHQIQGAKFLLSCLLGENSNQNEKSIIITLEINMHTTMLNGLQSKNLQPYIS